MDQEVLHLRLCEVREWLGTNEGVPTEGSLRGHREECFHTHDFILVASESTEVVRTIKTKLQSLIFVL